MNPTTALTRTNHLVATMGDQIATLTRTLGAWMQEQPRTLGEVEQHVLRLVKELGTALITGLCALAVPDQPLPSLACACGQQARYQRQRGAQVTTLLGSLSIHRPYYYCAGCRQGCYPLDAQLQICAGSRSAGLDELLALLGATQDSFAQAAHVLERLTLVHVSPNSVRAASEQLGTVLVAHQAQLPLDGPDHAQTLAPALPPVARLYISMDGVLAHLHESGWSEIKVGCCYQTRSRVDRRRPERLAIRAHSTSYVTALAEAHSFGEQMWREAVRRGALVADEVVVLGDGAHWIWNLAQTYFPGATQILDWYHASQYLWEPATAIWGESSSERLAWVQAQLDELWEGKVEQVLAALEVERAAGEAVTAALSYYTTHRSRMDYAAYRSRGLQIGSGSVESACKQLVSARLKQAGMIWDAAGAQAVATVRAWLKSERWEEAMALRPARGRTYQRQAGLVRAAEVASVVQEQGAVREEAVRPHTQGSRSEGLAPDVLMRVRAELAHEQATHPWRRAWSVRQQRAQQALPAE
jgi:Uncharacterised protein family (UPF0236)